MCAEGIMNYEVRIMKESDKTCSAKRTQTSRKRKAGTMKGRKVENPKSKLRKEGRITNHGSRIT